MKLKLENGTEYHARFQHGTEAVIGEAKPIYIRRFTRVSISTAIIGVILKLEGEAYCHPTDQFNKAKGRKLALARAIKDFHRTKREQIWKAYFAATGGPK